MICTDLDVDEYSSISINLLIGNNWCSKLSQKKKKKKSYEYITKTPKITRIDILETVSKGAKIILGSP